LPQLNWLKSNVNQRFISKEKKLVKHRLTAELLESHSHAFRIPLQYSMYNVNMEHTQLKTIPLTLNPKIEIATLLTECLKFFIIILMRI